jgi:hypothetical protein
MDQLFARQIKMVFEKVKECMASIPKLEDRSVSIGKNVIILESFFSSSSIQKERRR